MEEKSQDPGRISRREREMQRHRNEILEAALESFARHGYERTSMQEIAVQAELSVGKLYTHFEGKESIFREIVDLHMETIYKKIDQAYLGESRTVDKIRAGLRTAIEYFNDNIEFFRVYWERNRLNRFSDLKKVSEREIVFMSDMIEKAIEDGELSPGIDPRIHAAMMEGAGHRLLEVLFENGKGVDMIPEILDSVFLRPYEITELDRQYEKEIG